MRMRLAVCILVVLAFAASCTYAATVRISAGNYAALGWKETLHQGAEGTPFTSFTSDPVTVPSGVEGLQVSPGKPYGWASLSTQMFDGVLLSTVTTFKIRTMGYEGDGTLWEPPAVYLGVTKEGTNPRNMRALPYATFGRGTAGTFYEYDLLQCKYMINMSGSPIKTWSEMLATYPGARFSTAAQCAAIWSGQNFNVFSGSNYSAEGAYGSSARGIVDWVEIGFSDGTHYVYDFVVPEPGSILVLLTGVAGLIGFRKRS